MPPHMWPKVHSKWPHAIFVMHFLLTSWLLEAAAPFCMPTGGLQRVGPRRCLLSFLWLSLHHCHSSIHAFKMWTNNQKMSHFNFRNFAIFHTFEFSRHFAFVLICQFHPIQQLTFTKTRLNTQPRKLATLAMLYNETFCRYFQTLWTNTLITSFQEPLSPGFLQC